MIEDTSAMLYRALVVLTEDARHVDRLKEIDPVTLRQALEARKAYLVDQLAGMSGPFDDGALNRSPGLARLNRSYDLARSRVGSEIEVIEARLVEVQSILTSSN